MPITRTVIRTTESEAAALDALRDLATDEAEISFADAFDAGLVGWADDGAIVPITLGLNALDDEQARIDANNAEFAARFDTGELTWADDDTLIVR